MSDYDYIPVGTEWDRMDKAVAKLAESLSDGLRVETVTIPGTLPNLNEIINAAKTRWASYRDMKEANTELVAWCAKGIEKIDRAEFVFKWYAKDERTDPDNIAAAQKFGFDGLVKAGVLAKDGWKQVKKITHTFEVDKQNPRVEVEIWEVK